MILRINITGRILEEKLLKVAEQIKIRYKIVDARSGVLKKELERAGFKGKLKKVWLVDVYTIDKKLKKEEIEEIAARLTNPVTQEFTVNKVLSPKQFSWVIETGFLPGVTDNVGQTVKQITEDLLKVEFGLKEGVFKSLLVFLKGKLGRKDVEEISGELINPLIQRAKIKKFEEFKKDKGMGVVVPRVNLKGGKKVKRVNLKVSDKKLKEIGKKGIANYDGTRRGPLALDLVCMRAIRKYFDGKGRRPTDVELESIAQTWSEHCKHTIFASPMDEIKEGLFNRYIKGATEKIRKEKGKNDICVSVFEDNSGAIVFDKNWLITDKVETHNSPSALDPFGGAVTGIVGVNRDTIGFGLGAKPIINRYGFCFADFRRGTVLYKGANFKEKMLSEKRIMEGVIKGVNVGGNCSGIPTCLGFMYFDKRYRGKPLVFVGTVGLIPARKKKRVLYKKKARAGDYIVMAGGRVGADGIHGATFSSEEMDEGSPATAVQIGDPITQKNLSDAIVKEARDLGLYNSITDNGAGGLSCSVAEMARECGGCLVELEKVPLKYPGLSLWQIWISESQERMTLAVAPEKWEEFNLLMKKRGVEASVIGRFTDSGKCVVKYKGRVAMDVEMDFLHEGLPLSHLKTKIIKKSYPEPKIKEKKDLTGVLKKMLKSLNLASFEFISKQYDHEVQGGAVIKPLQGKGLVNNEAVVVRPVLSSKKGVVISYGLYPRYGLIDSYQMASCAIDTAVRNAITVGGSLNHLALLDNFCWCSSNEEERLGQLKKAAQACYDLATYYGTPFISGKDSMFNDFKGFDKDGRRVKISILPTLLISCLGVIDDIYKTVSIDVKFEGDLIYILGETLDEMGGSEYFKMWSDKKGEGLIGNKVPKVKGEKNKRMYESLSRAIAKDLVASAISVGKGGLGVSLAKMGIAGGLGIWVKVDSIFRKEIRGDYGLFSESQGRAVVSIDPKKKEKFEKALKGNFFKKIGRVVREKRMVVKRRGREIVNLDLNSGLKAYKSAFRDF